MYRGRGGQRKFGTPPHSSYGGGKKNWSPYNKKHEEVIPTGSKQSQNDQVKITTAPTATPTPPAMNNPSKQITPSKPEEKNGTQDTNTMKRERSRSPVDRKNDMSNNSPAPKPEVNIQETEEMKDTKVQINTINKPRYAGKEGEKKFSGRCRLFIANLNNNTTEEELRELFSQFGETGEVFVNKEKGFGFIRLDYRHNAEIAKSTLDKTMLKGRNIQVRFATHASAIEIHGLDRFASNEYIEKAMTQFGKVERSVVVCDDRGRSKGYAIVEFEWKKSAQKVLDRFKGEMFVLGRLPKPVFAKPLTQMDEEEGIREAELEKCQGIETERDFQPRFISPSSFEYTWAKKWRDLYIEEEDKKARLEQELRDARYKLELEMESAYQEQEAMKMREELRRRQEELRQFEENLIRRQEMTQRFGREALERNRLGRDDPPMPGDMVNPAQNDFRLQQQAELGLRSNMLHPPGLPVSLPPHGLLHQLPPGVLQAGGKPLPPPPAIPGIHMRPPHGGGPPRDMAPHRGDRFDQKRQRRE